MKSKLFIIKYFNIDTIYLNNLPLIDQNEKELIFNLNIICTYIYYLENDKINEERIIISPLEGEQSNVMEFFPKDFYNIIKNYLKDNYNKNYLPNYYQFIAFVDILSGLLKIFSQNFYLYPEILRKEGQYKDMLKCRKLIIKKLIELTKICSILPFKRISEGQQFTYNQIKNIYNSKFENNKAIDFLPNQDRITFDILSGGIVLINKNEQSLSIITNINKLNQSDINILISLLNSKILLI